MVLHGTWKDWAEEAAGLLLLGTSVLLIAFAVPLSGLLWGHPAYGVVLGLVGYGLTALGARWHELWAWPRYLACGLAAVHLAAALLFAGRWAYFGWLFLQSSIPIP